MRTPSLWAEAPYDGAVSLAKKRQPRRRPLWAELSHRLKRRTLVAGVKEEMVGEGMERCRWD